MVGLKQAHLLFIKNAWLILIYFFHELKNIKIIITGVIFNMSELSEIPSDLLFLYLINTHLSLLSCAKKMVSFHSPYDKLTITESYGMALYLVNFN